MLCKVACLLQAHLQGMGTVCRGVQFASARSSVASDPFYAGMAVLRVLMDQAPANTFEWDGSWFGHPGSDLMDWYTGTPLVREMLNAGASASAIAQHFAPEAKAFHEETSSYYLY